MKRYLISLFVIIIMIFGAYQVTNQNAELSEPERQDQESSQLETAETVEIARNRHPPHTADAWGPSLNQSDLADLAAAMQSLSHNLAEQDLAGRMITLQWQLSANSLQRGDPKGLEIIIRRQNMLSIPFTIQILNQEDSIPEGIIASVDWNQIHFAAGEAELKLTITAEKTENFRPIDILRLDIITPSFVASEVKQIAILVKDNNASFSDDSLIAELSSNDSSTKKLPFEIAVGGTTEQEAQSLVLSITTPSDIESRQLIYHQHDKGYAWIIYLVDSSLYMGVSRSFTGKGQDKIPWRTWYFTVPILPNQAYVAALSLDQEHQLKGWINALFIDSFRDPELAYTRLSKLTVGGSNSEAIFHDGSLHGNHTKFKGEFHQLQLFSQPLENTQAVAVSRVFMQKLGLFDQPILRMKGISNPREGRDTSIDVELYLSYSTDKEIVLQPIYRGIAQFGYDYQGPTNITIPPYNTRQLLQLPLIDDKIIENNEDILLSFAIHDDLNFDQPFVKLTIEDNDGLDIREGISLWLSSESDGLRHTVNPGIPIIDSKGKQAVVRTSPFYGNSLAFNENESLVFGDHPLINSGGPYAAKSLAVALRTSTDVQSRQMIYQQGNQLRGLNLLIQNGLMEFTVHNLAPDSNQLQSWGPISVELPVEELSNIFVVCTFDTTSKTIQIHINGQASKSATLSEMSEIYSHRGSASFGSINETARLKNGEAIGPGSYLKGEIAEAILFHRALSAEEIALIFDYWQRKY